MRFHEFGDRSNKIIILIHGTLTPWQIWQEQIDYFKEKYFVIVPALDAHVEEEPSEYISVEAEATAIEKYVCENYGKEVFAVCGLSMGGVIACTMFVNGRLGIANLVLDGAPLIPANALMKNIMTGSYLSIIHKSKKRDKKVLENFKKDFLPERYLESYLRFADTMSDDSVKNMLASVCNGCTRVCDNVNNTRILFLHGTKGNEMLSKKSAQMMKRNYSGVEIMCFKGLKHAELAIYKAEQWIEVVDKAISEMPVK